ncbi:Phospholipase A(2) [Ferrimonas balearica DSM 9799]|uniref:Phospholipase A1 n=1 Tax=Ferrimonas balearica (strain DSM 9799 / CCM 4581 / KCTC 23876 / PAT) TaxID=550540 RepID=E1SMZ3_FERBD|nr:phospholipase A [Ferrimonas balearica]ADN76662.1 Phospholipase A(2) [Ferrimonas balearica DSM 9799]MBY5982267.1 phospholipase A [Ferrimonas balearica]
MSAISWLVLAAAASNPCLEEQLRSGHGDTTLEELRALCQLESDPTTSSAEERIESEISTSDERFALNAHYNNYILPASYNRTPNEDGWRYHPESMDNWEVKFQLSVKVPVTPSWFGGKGRVFVAYTNQSWWQAYNKDASSPFRETNHMPEIIYFHRPGWEWGGWQVDSLSLAFNHQSNGQSGSQSRSWNRLIGGMAVSKGDWALGAQTWYRLKEDPKAYPDDPRGDDNPDITDYMGYSEFLVVHKREQRNLSLRVRGNFNTGKGGMEAGWSFPIWAKLRGFVQVYYGYGESLIDYNVKSERVSLGFEFTPWL